MTTQRRRRHRPNVLTHGTLRPTRAAWRLVALLCVLGLVVRAVGLNATRQIGPDTVPFSRWQPTASHALLENDEKIYLALVEQLNAGRGYTLRGHTILNEPWIVPEQYGRALFFHPPGGVALLWVFFRAVGEAGPAVAEVVCFLVFFGSLIALGATLLAPLDSATVVLLAVSGAFSPIMAHVMGRLWLDGPLLAWTTAAWALFIFGQRQRRTSWVCAAGALLGFASLIKLTAFLAVPGILASAWCLAPREDRRALARWSVLFVSLGILVQLPWELWQWRVVGTAFPDWAGRPAAALVEANAYVHYLTVTRPPWIYLELLPQVIWTLVPSLLLLALQWRHRYVRAHGCALVGTIAVVVIVLIGLGAIGYSKVLRYAVLVTPAASLLFALVVGHAMRTWRAERRRAAGRAVIVVMLALALALAGLGLEVAQSLKTTFADSGRDLIVPLTGLRDLS